MEKLGLFIIKNAKKIVPICVLIALSLVMGIFRIKIDANLKSMLPHDIDVVKINDRMEEMFGGAEMLIIAIGNKQQDIFNKRTLAKIKELTGKFESVKGVDDVMSLSTIKNMKVRDWGLEVFDYMPEVPETEKEIEKLKKEILSDDVYSGQIVSKDGKWTAIMVSVSPSGNENKIYKEIKKITEQYKGPEEICMAGNPAIRAEVANNIIWDLLKLIVFVLLIIVLILRLSLGTKQGTILPLAVVGLSAGSTLGIMGYTGLKITMLNNILPILLLAIGTAYGIHVIARFYEEMEKTNDKEKAIIATLRDVGIPVFLAALTTIAGFMTLLTAPLSAFWSFGIFASIGIFFELVLSLLFIPSVLYLTHKQEDMKKSKIAGPLGEKLDRFLDWIVNVVKGQRIIVILTGLAIFVIFSLSLPRLHIEMNPITFFKKSSPIRISEKVINENMGGSVNLSVMITDDMKNPDVLKEIDKMQLFLEKDERITHTLSLATMIKRINKTINGDKFNKIPDKKEQVSQLLLLYSMSSSPEDFNKFVDTNYEHGRIIARMENLDTKQIREIASKFEKYIKDEKPKIKKIELTGFAMIIKELVDLIVRSQLMGLVSGIIMVFLM
ncbi:MAG: MMPL family transporter, partial [Candidatus Goldbacteria bacterium]|nr:MMPL family transporter [Candidatus Goldiibacteriota bacterium]